MSEPGSSVEGAEAIDGDREAALLPGVREGTHERPGGATRPLVLPETFDGTGSWSEWCFHFENVAAVNGWDGAQKLQWLRVRVTGRAQKALLRLHGPATTSFEATRDALKARFEPESRYTRYQAEFQARRKKASEGWADFADELRSLVDKAYPGLQEEARERLAINAYLTQLPQPQISFSVRQKRPATLDDAVSATLEMESYLPLQPAVNSLVATEEPAVNVDAVDRVAQLTCKVEELAKQLEGLQQRSGDARGDPSGGHQRRQRPSTRPRRWFEGRCWSCQQTGHRARDCPLSPPQQHQLGN